MCVSWYLWTAERQILIWPILKIGIKKYPCSEHIPTLESEMFWTASLRRGQRMHLRQLLKCELSGGGRVGRPRWPKNCRRRPRWKSRKVEKSVKQTCRRYSHPRSKICSSLFQEFDRSTANIFEQWPEWQWLFGRVQQNGDRRRSHICHLQIDFDTRSFSNMVTIPLIRKWKVKL